LGACQLQFLAKSLQGALKLEAPGLTNPFAAAGSERAERGRPQPTSGNGWIQPETHLIQRSLSSSPLPLVTSGCRCAGEAARPSTSVSLRVRALLGRARGLPLRWLRAAAARRLSAAANPVLPSTNSPADELPVFQEDSATSRSAPLCSCSAGQKNLV
jgi:hypothetical protein